VTKCPVGYLAGFIPFSREKETIKERIINSHGEPPLECGSFVLVVQKFGSPSETQKDSRFRLLFEDPFMY
jgi:hypothetical protein